jgi:hypothetical protein
VVGTIVRFGGRCHEKGFHNMRDKMSRRRMRSAATLAAGALLAGGVGVARADLPSVEFDLRVHGTGEKEATVGNGGEYVLLDLYAVLHDLDGDPSNDSLGIASGNFRSSTGGLLGNLFALQPPPPFNSLGSTAGTPADLDGDGDLDIGTNGTSASGAYAVRSGAVVDNPPGGQLIAHVLFFTQPFGSADSTEVNYLQRTVSTGLLAAFDGGPLRSPSPDTFTFSDGTPVVVSGVPEVDPPDARYLDGTIDEHLRVKDAVRVTPGGSLSLTTGFDLTATGSLEGRQGSLSIAVNDDSSRNAGGRLVAGPLSIGTTANGTFTQADGVTHVGSVTVGGAGTGVTGTLNLNGGSTQATAVRVGAGGMLRAAGGDAIFQSLLMSGGAAAEQRGASIFVIGNAFVGLDGPSTLIHTGGDTTVSGTLLLGAGSGGAGTLDLRGGALTAGAVNVGGPSVVGRVTQVGGSVLAGALRVGYPTATGISTYAVSAGQVAATNITVNAQGVVNQTGGDVRVTGTFRNSLSIPSAGSAPAQYAISGGTLTAPFLRVSHTNASPIEATGHTGGFVQTGGTVNVMAASIAPGGTYEALGGTLNVAQSFSLGGVLDFGGNSAVVNFGTNSLANFTQGQILNGSSATMTGGAGSLLDFASFEQYQSIGTVQTAGMIHISGQPLAVSSAQSVSGSGTITGDVTNDGTVSPDAMTVAGNYAQTDGGALSISFGDSSDQPADLLDVLGAADLAGDLRVSLLDGFVPSPEDRFTILEAASLSGTFDNAASFLDVPGGRFDVVYTPTEVTLTNFQPVPDPTAVALLVAGAAGVAVRRRRRRR